MHVELPINNFQILSFFHFFWEEAKRTKGGGRRSLNDFITQYNNEKSPTSAVSTSLMSLMVYNYS